MTAEPHIWPVRVYFEDTDAGGVVYYANYLRFVERARTEMLRGAGFDHTRLAAEFGVQMVVRACTVDFIAPARLDDALEVRSTITTMGGASFMIRQEVFLVPSVKSEIKKLVSVEVRLACVDLAFCPKRLPEPLKRALGHRKAI
jgi:acyl-CoA thioester hydrolase